MAFRTVISGWHERKGVCVQVCAWILHFLCWTSACAQSTWEVTPYRTRVWWTAGSQPNLPQSWAATFGDHLNIGLRTTFRAAWDGTVERAPAELAPALLQRFEDVSREELFAAAPDLLKIDKLFLVAIRGTRRSYQVQVRELDCRLAHWGPFDQAEVTRLSQLAARTSQLIESAFSPVVRIDRVVEKRARVRLRAGALIRTDVSPGSLQRGDILLPFDRRVGTDGQTRVADIRPVDWTYLQVTQAQQDQRLQAEIISGYRQPLRSKRSRRQEQLAIRARPTNDHSTIRLRSRAKVSQPLIGYEIHEKGEEATEFVGYTDFRGELSIPRTRRPIRILLVKSGNRVTAKLPIVPGLRDVVVASMLDDRQRVETDGFLSGIQIALIDLVARRESLGARIRLRIADGDLDTAEELLQSFRSLPSRSDFQSQIQQQQQALNVTNAQLRKRIDTMFVDAYRTLGQYLDPNQLRQLESELQAARNALSP